MQAWWKQGGRGAKGPDFGRSEGTGGQRRCTALLLAHPDFQSLRHPCNVYTAIPNRKTGFLQGNLRTRKFKLHTCLGSVQGVVSCAFIFHSVTMDFFYQIAT